MAVCDVLIIGSGIAGLSLAIKLNKEFPDRKIFIVTRSAKLNPAPGTPREGFR
jgi:protoporphyrinogen oxidase